MVVVYANQELIGYLTPRGIYLSVGGLDTAIGSMKGSSGAGVPHTYSPANGMKPAALSFPTMGAAKQGVGALKGKASFAPAPTAQLSDDDMAMDMHEDDDDDMPAHEEAQCPVCDGPGSLLGHLGSRAHFRCRNCGMDYSHDTRDDRTELCELSEEDRKNLRPSTEAKLSDSVSPSDADKTDANSGMDMSEDDPEHNRKCRECGGNMYRKERSGKVAGECRNCGWSEPFKPKEKAKKSERPVELSEDRDQRVRFYEDPMGDYHSRLGTAWNLTLKAKKGEAKKCLLSEYCDPEFKRGLQEVALGEVPGDVVSSHMGAWRSRMKEPKQEDEMNKRPVEDRAPGSQKVTNQSGKPLGKTGDAKLGEEPERGSREHIEGLSQHLYLRPISTHHLVKRGLDRNTEAMSRLADAGQKLRQAYESHPASECPRAEGGVKVHRPEIACPKCDAINRLVDDRHKVLNEVLASDQGAQLSEKSLRSAGLSDSDMAYLGLDPKAFAPNGAVRLSEKTTGDIHASKCSSCGSDMKQDVSDKNVAKCFECGHSEPFKAKGVYDDSRDRMVSPSDVNRHSFSEGGTTKATKKTESQYDPGLLNLENGAFKGTVLACPDCGTERKPEHSFGGFVRVKCPNCGQQDYVYSHDATGEQGYEPVGEYTKVSDGVGKHKNPDKPKKMSTGEKANK